MGFPILKLPVVALKVLVDHLNDVELVTASLLSRRAAWFLKACGKKNVSFFNLPATEIKGLRRFRKLQLFLLESKRQGQLPDWNFHLRCSMGELSSKQLQISCNLFNIPIYFDNLKHIKWVEGVRRTLKIGESLIRVVLVPNGIHTFWRNETDGLIQLLGYFKTELNLSIGHLKLHIYIRDLEALERVVNQINSTETVVKNVLVERYPRLPDDRTRFFLENVWCTEKFSFHWKLSPSFKFNGVIRAKTIEIRFGHWFTIQNILRCTESEVINVAGSKFTQQQLRLFLSEWRAGKLPKLKEVNLSTRVSAQEVTRGFERWVGRCDKCGFNDVSIISIKGYGDFHGSVDANLNYFHMSIHSNNQS